MLPVRSSHTTEPSRSFLYHVESLTSPIYHYPIITLSFGKLPTFNIASSRVPGRFALLRTSSRTGAYLAHINTDPVRQTLAPLAFRTTSSRALKYPRQRLAHYTTSHSFNSWSQTMEASESDTQNPVPMAQINGPPAAMTAEQLEAYSFPQDRLKRVMNDSSKTPLLLVACGSFSPITYLHLRMFEMAADYVKFNTDFELVGGYLSPVSDAYKKAGLASAEHR